MTVTLPVPFRSSRVLSLGDELLPGRGVALDETAALAHLCQSGGDEARREQ